MRELSYVTAILAAAVLIVAAAAWFRIQRNPKDDLRAGQRGKPDSIRLKTASWLLSAALAIAGLAALFALVSLVMRTLKIP
jgi:predicted Co/Zn/Cd cation transporter (cation efflux family)